ncbi:MAG: hypothetical protein GY792_22175, partial [Gammaproteobacteria bacterium]|nr:hypothetical protein [Gammaproteobacteria bacterium]
QFVDTGVTTGQTYLYAALAFDTSWNRSGLSNPVSATAEDKLVEITFLVRVPDYTPGIVYLVGDIPELAAWNPSALPMTPVTSNTWTITRTVLDSTPFEFKYTRGSWDTVENWGAISGLNNRLGMVSYGADGTQLIDNTARDWGNGPDDEKAVRYWRDPLVVQYAPANGAVNVSLSSVITVTWSETMTLAASFDITSTLGPVTGTFGYDEASHTVSFTPTGGLAPGTVYTVSVAGQVDAGGDVQ